VTGSRQQARNSVPKTFVGIARRYSQRANFHAKSIHAGADQLKNSADLLAAPGIARA
jgi:hypothetical protein